MRKCIFEVAITFLISTLNSSVLLIDFSGYVKYSKIEEIKLISAAVDYDRII
jgi:hypothetical protein